MNKISIERLLRERILVLDGAMGTQIQGFRLSEEDYRGAEFAQWDIPLKGNNDLLVLTRPEVIREIHRRYLDAGADIIETNTFNATSVSLADYGMQALADRMNREAVRMARQIAQEYTERDPLKPRFVVGSIGPTNKSLSLSPDVNNPSLRSLTFDELAESYGVQIRAMVEEGVDGLLIETIFDTLNAKAALFAALQLEEVASGRIPILLSVTLADQGGRTLSGQTLDAFLASIEHAPILSIGFNCSFGASQMKPFLEQLRRSVGCFVSAYPNAGMPNELGAYDQTPDVMALQVKEYLQEGLVNIIGGCCGTSPDHIAAVSDLLRQEDFSARAASFVEEVGSRGGRIRSMAMASGLEILSVPQPQPALMVIGERCNVAGSRKFLRLIKEGSYEEALEIARSQVEAGAHLIDVNMDDGMLDATEQMTVFLNYMMAEPDICRIPVMIDSSRWEAVEAGLKCVQGKCVVNSISLKEGEGPFLEKARFLQQIGAAVVVMAFDEKGQADTRDRKIEVCERAYRLLVDQVDFTPTDIIFDPNVLAVGTGIEEHRTYAVDFIEATRWIKQNLPGAKVSGGISNLSFSFRGNNPLREAIHCLFLHYALEAGLDMAIVNPSENRDVQRISPEWREAIEDLLFDRREDATDRVLAIAAHQTEVVVQGAVKTEHRLATPEERLIEALRKGTSDTLESDLQMLMDRGMPPLQIIDEVLMKGIQEVGDLFGAGKMFLPQVVKTARTMKKAVGYLPIAGSQAQSGSEENSGQRTKKIILATVKGDVHDIGKNIVGVVLSCNGFEVIDLGVMVPTEEIVAKAKELQPDMVGLSGLITPSLEEMCVIATEFEKEGLKIPIVVGGATTSLIHTAVKIAPLYSGTVIHGKDASKAPEMLTRWLNLDTREAFEQEMREEYQSLRDSIKEQKRISLSDAIRQKYRIDFDHNPPIKPKQKGVSHFSFEVSELIPLINWRAFFAVWKMSPTFAELKDLHDCPGCRSGWLAKYEGEQRHKAEEALRLFIDAQEFLQKEAVANHLQVNAVAGIYDAASDGENLLIQKINGERILFPIERQTKEHRQSNDPYLSLVDFVKPVMGDQLADYVGGFGVTVSKEWEELLQKHNEEGDPYKALLVQSLSDRMAEAGAEYLHWLVRTQLWGYEEGSEGYDAQGLLACQYQGIRPAVGYPSIPEQKANFILDNLIDLSSIGIQLTENGAMSPAASVSGLIFAHPESKYFSVK